MCYASMEWYVWYDLLLSVVKTIHVIKKYICEFVGNVYCTTRKHICTNYKTIVSRIQIHRNT